MAGQGGGEDEAPKDVVSGRDRDLLDRVLFWLVGPLASRYHRRRTFNHDVQYNSEWQRLNPGCCMYCAYTRWANIDMGQNLKLEPHNCKEGLSPPYKLPVARLVKK